MVLTKAGWPRPIVDGWPIPWVSPSDDLSTMNSPRADACASGAICAVCGEGYSEGEPAYAVVMADATPADLTTVKVRPMDNAVMHQRCALLALKHCPRLIRLRKEGSLQLVKTAGNSGSVEIDEEGGVYGTLDGAECEPADISTLKGTSNV